MIDCPHRGRLIAGGQCYCRHPQVTGPRRRSTPVALSRCETCPIPTGGDLTQLALPSTAPAGGPGTELVTIYRSRGVPSCQQCQALADKMNAWGPDECRRKIDQIVAEVLPRARHWVDRGFLTRLAPNVALRALIRADVLRAIETATP